MGLYTHTQLQELELALIRGDVENKSELNGWTRLHNAARYADLSLVRLLLHFQADVHAQSHWGEQPIHMTVGCCGEPPGNEDVRAEIIGALCDAGADPNARDNNGDTPLSLAYGWDLAACVRALLRAEADPSMRGREGARIPPFVADLLRTPDGSEVVAATLAQGASANEIDENGHSLLDRAAFYGSPSAILALLRAGADPNLNTRCPPLFSAVFLIEQDGGGEAIATLVNAGANVNAQTSRSRQAPLHRAVQIGSLAAIRILVDSGADLNSVDCGGLTPLHYAVAGLEGDDEAAVDVELPCSDVDGDSHSGGSSTPSDIVELSDPTLNVRPSLAVGAPSRSGDDSDSTLPSHALTRPDHLELVCVLIRAGADVNAKDSHGETPLHYASRRGLSLVTKLLLESGADPHSRDAQGRTPLHSTALRSKAARKKSLGSDEDNVTALLQAGAEIDAKDSRGATPLCHAIRSWSIPAVCALLHNGADPCFEDAPGPIPLRLVLKMIIGGAAMDKIIVLVEHMGVSISVRMGRNSFSDAEKDSCKALMSELRNQMLAQPPSMRGGFISQLSKLYALLDYYPSDCSLDEREITRSKDEPTGRGGFADCFEGMFLGCHKVAMKAPRGRLEKEVRDRRLAREIRVWKELKHPNVLPFLGSCTIDSVPYLISPWMENGHLLMFVKKHPEADSLDLLIQIAEGLKYLHTFKTLVVHGDLRAPNILVSKSGRACIADFGLSELKTDCESYSTPWITAGHPRWQAPEIMLADTKEEARRTTASDVFAFGRVMLELFTKSRPFSNISHDAVVAREVRQGRAPVRPRDSEVIARGLDDAMWDLMTDCWNLDALQRPSATDLVSRLRTALEAQNGREPSSRPTRRSRSSEEL